MRAFLKFLCIAAVVTLLVPAVAEARRGGGSMGGRSGFSSGRSSSSSVGSRSSSSSSSSSSWGRSSRSSSGSSVVFLGGMGGGYHSGGGGGGGGSAFLVILVIFAIIAILIYVKYRRDRAKMLGGAGGVRQLGEGTCSFSRVSVCFLATESALQEDLVKLAESGKAGTKVGDAWIIREVATLMARSQDAINRFYFEQVPGLSDSAAASKLEEVGMDLRSRYDEEEIRGDEGGTRRKVGDKDDDEVSEYIVVSMAVAFNPPTLQRTQVTDVLALVSLLREMGSIGSERLLGMEVAWDPVSADEKLTSAELDRHYPELLPI